MPNVLFQDGPWDGRTMDITDPLPYYYAMSEPDRFVQFRGAVGHPPSQQRIRYEKVSGTTDPVIYQPVQILPSHQVIELAKKAGIKVLPWQEEVLRQTFDPKPVGHYEVWEEDTAGNRIGTFATRELAQQCVDENRRLRSIYVRGTNAKA
jgi:hypothetical protein